MSWSPQELDKIITDIRALPAFCADYDMEFEPIHIGAIDNAVDIMVRTQEYVPPNLDTPHVTTDGDGAVLLEWWVGPRKLSLYISYLLHKLNHSKYLKIWGPNIFTEMDEGVIDNMYTLQECWQWLLGDEEKGKTLAEVFKDTEPNPDVDSNWINNL